VRDWLNAIYAFIGTSSLTDPEYAGIDTDLLTLNTYNQAAYDALAAVLTGRDAVSTMQDRLVAFFKAKGLDVAALNTASSNIYLGSVL
jgi:hypothetical protein